MSTNNPMLQSLNSRSLARALRGEVIPPPMPEIGDYVRVTEELDGDFGLIGYVFFVTHSSNPTLRDVSIKLNPFSGGVQSRRTISPHDIAILTAMETLAMVSQ